MRPAFPWLLWGAVIMFDIYCPHCGEPWDQDYLHTPGDLGGPENLTYSQAAASFKRLGCGLFRFGGSAQCNAAPVESPERLAMIRAGMDLSPHPDEWNLF